jgi:hypothetical protein
LKCNRREKAKKTIAAKKGKGNKNCSGKEGDR